MKDVNDHFAKGCFRMAQLARSAIVLIAAFGGFSCTNAERAKLSGFGSDHTVKCYSGGVVIFDGVASGKVLSEETSDGYYFTDKATGKLTEVSGSCVIVKL